MKYILIPFIALGFTLSLIFRIEYNCEGQELFPIYYGAPFVFQQTSLGSSMEYYYSISGLFLNVIVWSSVIVFIRFGILKLIEATSNNKIIKITYKIMVGFLLFCSIVIIAASYITNGGGFNENLNYWYWNLDKEASDWGMKCEGEWKISL